MQSVRELLRPAQMIHAVYEKSRNRSRREQPSSWTRLECRMDEARRLRRGIVKAQALGWHFAAHQTQQRLAAVLDACKDGAIAMRAECLETVMPIPSPAILLAELDQMYAEFDPVLIDTKQCILAIHTDAIVLEDVSLGSFLVRLNWTQLTEPKVSCFDVVPLQPNYPSSDDNVPHPHVRGQKLCAGDATVPVQRALEQGRLVDAFHLMCAVLETYNSGSTYVSLSDWEGVACWNCSSTTTSEDRSFCEGCDHDVCDDCLSSCKHCNRTRCSSCIGQCNDCEAPCCIRCLKKATVSQALLCKDCLRVCDGCGASIAAKDLDVDTELCPACHDAQPDEETPALSDSNLSPSLEGDAPCDPTTPASIVNNVSHV